MQRVIDGNHDTTLLKVIAGICMVIDHIGARLFPRIMELRIIGRIAFPLYVWCLVVGACYTRSAWKYALRLLLAGLISQPFYMLGLNHGWDRLNVFATLLTGYLGIVGMQKKRYGSQFWAPLAAIAFSCAVKVDYGWRGVLLIMLIYLVRRRREAVAALMIAFCLFWGINSALIQQICGISLQGRFFDLDPVKGFLRLQALAILALPLILWRRECRLPARHKRLAYAVYPAHLLILWLVELGTGVMTVQQSMHLLIPWWM